MHRLLLTLAFAAAAYGTPLLSTGRILDGAFHWENTGILTGSFVGFNGLTDQSKPAFTFINIRNEDSTRCVLDMWTCNIAGDYFSDIAVYRNRVRPDMWFNAGMWDMNFAHFDQSKWTKPRFIVNTPFQMFTEMSIFGGNQSLFNIAQGLKGKARLVVVGRPGAYEIESADFDLVANPEPATMLMIGTGVAGLAWWRRRKSGKIEA